MSLFNCVQITKGGLNCIKDAFSGNSFLVANLSVLLICPELTKPPVRFAGFALDKGIFLRLVTNSK